METELGTFIKDFGRLAQLALTELDQVADGNALLEAITAHMGVPAAEVSVVVEAIPAHRLVDLDILMESLAGPLQTRNTMDACKSPSMSRAIGSWSARSARQGNTALR